MPVVILNPETWPKGKLLRVPIHGGKMIRWPLTGDRLDVPKAIADYLLEKSFARTNDPPVVQKQPVQTTVEKDKKPIPPVEKKPSPPPVKQPQKPQQEGDSTSATKSNVEQPQEETTLTPEQEQILAFYNNPETDFTVVRGIGDSTDEEIKDGIPHSWASLTALLTPVRLKATTDYLKETDNATN